MTLLVHGDVVLLGGRSLLDARRRGSPRGSGTAGRNVSAAHRRGTAAAALLPTAALILLRKSSHATQE